jgi:hypothetical protein
MSKYTYTYNTMTLQNWGDIYIKLYEVYDDCGKNYHETYREKLGEILDYLIDNKTALIYNDAN